MAEEGAGNILPVGLRVRHGCHGQILGWARDRPAGLGDPHGLALGCTDGRFVRVEERGVGIRDAVVHRGLEVRVAIHANPVAGGGDGVVAAVDPCGPCVDMANREAGRGGAVDCGPNLLDVAHQRIRLRTRATVILNARGADAVQVLAADTDASNQAGQARAVLVDGAREGGHFVVEIGLAGRSPEGEEQGGLGVDGGGDGAGGCVGGVRLNHRVQTGRRELAIGALQALRPLEQRFEVRLESRGVVGVGRAIVEARIGRFGGDDRGRRRCERGNAHSG